ncbi:MAG: hypothetical protein AB7O38_22325, partial [Pirellulaceae bacterium]
ANPHTQSGRTHHTIQISFDDGETWPASHHRLLDEGRGAGYPSLTQVDQDHVGLVYEGSQSHLVFQKFAIAELLEPVTPGQLADAAAALATTFSVRIDRGEDRGQSFGSLFEVTSRDGSYTVGAGFPNLYNTRYRGDRHAVQFFVRPNREARSFSVKPLPRPNDLCGTYLFGRDGTVYSTYGGIKAWDPALEAWREAASVGGTDETLRVGDGELVLGDSRVHYNGKLVLAPPARGSYQLFYYAHGHLCFYHVQRGNGPYRPYVNDKDGFSRLYACPWTPAESQVDLSRAVTLTLPIVGETTIAWGQLDGQIVTGSNIGGFYVFEAGAWQTLRAPQLGVSYQLYSTMAFQDRLLMGQYPTGRIFAYDGKRIIDRAGWPPKLPGVSGSAREAQTSVIYGGEVLVGVWPWGELWRYNPGSQTWSFMQRMFDHPELSEAVVHPYDVENRGHAVGNLWGQRVTSLVANGSDLFVSTSAKSPHEWDAAQFPFLAPDRWRSYGKVYRLTMPGHLSAPTAWTAGSTTLEFTIGNGKMRISQDGRELARSSLEGLFTDSLVAGEEKTWGDVTWGAGIYGRFAGVEIEGSTRSAP